MTTVLPIMAPMAGNQNFNNIVNLANQLPSLNVGKLSVSEEINKLTLKDVDVDTLKIIRKSVLYPPTEGFVTEEYDINAGPFATAVHPVGTLVSQVGGNYAFCFNGNSNTSQAWSSIREGTILCGGGTGGGQGWLDMGFTNNYAPGALTVSLNITHTVFSALPLDAMAGGTLSITTHTTTTSNAVSGTYRILTSSAVAANTPGPWVFTLADPLNGNVVAGGTATTGDVATLIYGRYQNVWPCRTIDVPVCIAQTNSSPALPYFWCQLSGRTTSYLLVDTTAWSITTPSPYNVPMPGSCLYVVQTGTAADAGAFSTETGKVVSRPNKEIRMQVSTAWAALAIASGDIVRQLIAGVTPAVSVATGVVMAREAPPGSNSPYLRVRVQQGEFTTQVGFNLQFEKTGTPIPGGPLEPAFRITKHSQRVAGYLKDHLDPNLASATYGITMDMNFQ